VILACGRSGLACGGRARRIPLARALYLPLIRSSCTGLGCRWLSGLGLCSADFRRMSYLVRYVADFHDELIAISWVNCYRQPEQ
jgi:hypothetical protein